MQRRPITLLQNTFVEIIVVMNIQAPATDIGNVHVESFDFGGLGDPDEVVAGFVLIPDRDLKQII